MLITKVKKGAEKNVTEKAPQAPLHIMVEGDKKINVSTTDAPAQDFSFLEKPGGLLY